MYYNRFFAAAILAEGSKCSVFDMDVAGRTDFIAMYRMGGPL